MQFKNHIFGFETTFQELYSYEGLCKLHNKFISNLYSQNPAVAEKLEKAYTGEHAGESPLILEIAEYLSAFITKLFNLELEEFKQQHLDFEILYKFKRQIIQRKIAKSTEQPKEDIQFIQQKLKDLGIDPLNELGLAKKYFDGDEEIQELIHNYCLCVLKNKVHAKGILFNAPEKIDADNLIKADNSEGHYYNNPENCHTRKGFDCSDEGVSLNYALDQANYCVKCHFRNKDSCSKGFKDSDAEFQKNEHNITLNGCPLEVKISEMNILKSDGNILGSLATVMIDNPMLPATGNRICNDCMKSCIFQKQTPVDIPSIESRILQDVLNLPYGFEIYSLLTRWNPLNFKNPVMAKENGIKVLVVGLGPAGFTMSHYLANYGYQVVSIDGMKLEPLDEKLLNTPIKDVNSLYENLSSRASKGFGGVAEYGITVRWNKNNLDIMRLVLARKENVEMFGSIRFGGTITIAQAKKMGFKHIAMCLGAGKPNIPNIPNALAPNVRTASDFLMALQTTGAFRTDNLANLQIRMPIAVIGGGLTAVDTATEALIYYMTQVEKILVNYEKLGEEIFTKMTNKEKEITNEFISHAKLLRQNPNSRLELLREWGGVNILYRKKLQQSPAYRLNHEELAHAFKEGVEFVENINPLEIAINTEGVAIGVKHAHGEIPANSIFLAIGTSPNTVIAREESEYFEYDEKFLQAINPYNGEKLKIDENCKTYADNSFVYKDDDISITTHGDLHKSFAGNVVKAMASSKNNAPYIHKYLADKWSEEEFDKGFYSKVQNNFTAKVHQINRLTKGIVEIVIHAPLAAKNFKAGQFYRLQNYEANAPVIEGRTMTIEPLALTGASHEPERGLISLIVLEMAGSSDICAILKPQEEVSLMGPTGTPSFIPKNKKVLLIGGGLGNAVLFSVAKAMQTNGCEIVYFAGYRHAYDVFKREEIERSAQHIVWCCDEEKLAKVRSNDVCFQGNMVEALENYVNGEFDIAVKSSDIDHILVIGSDGLMSICANKICGEFSKFFKPNVEIFASINSPMQCMMKEICAQCLARHVDPVTGEEKYVFSCFNQDQNAKMVDFKHLSGRLKQNSIQEKITATWLRKYLKNTYE